MKKTKIICTMGPNTNDRELMKKLVENGMDIARFNFSHGDHEEQKSRMDMLKAIREEAGKPIAILLDTKGPEIRTGASVGVCDLLPKKWNSLKAGEYVDDKGIYGRHFIYYKCQAHHQTSNKKFI